jgi:hypothetical protein
MRHVLSSSAVDTLLRLARCAVAAACAAVVTLQAQAPGAQQLHEIARELAEKIAAKLTPDDRVDLAAGNGEASRSVERDVASLLRERGARLSGESQGTLRIRITCSDTTRDRVCVAELRRADTRETLLSSRQRDRNVEGALPVAVLDARPVFAERQRILDFVQVDGRLLVLDVNGLSLYERDRDGGWNLNVAAPIAGRKPLPRDARGRLKITGTSALAFLPGLTCRCTLDPLQTHCTETEHEAWPVGIPGSDLAAGGNYFTSAMAPVFFSAASLRPQEDVWLVAGVDARLHVLDSAFTELGTLQSPGDDIAAVNTLCGSGRQVIVALSNGKGAGTGAVQAYEMTGANLTPFTPASGLPGVVTALWPGPDERSASVVVHNREMQRYEAFQVGIACLAR